MNHITGEKPLTLNKPHSLRADHPDHGQVVVQVRRTALAIQSALSLDILPRPSRTPAGVTA